MVKSREMAVKPLQEEEIEIELPEEIERGYIELEPITPEEQRIYEEFKNKEFKNSLNKLLPQKLIPVVIELSGINENKKVRGVNISRHIGLTHSVPVYGTEIIDMIEKPVRINCLVTEKKPFAVSPRIPEKSLPRRSLLRFAVKDLTAMILSLLPCKRERRRCCATG